MSLTTTHMGHPVDAAENSRARRGRQHSLVQCRWLSRGPVVYCSRCQVQDTDWPVLIVPYNPTARLAMVRHTVDTLWPRAKGKAREKREAQVLFVLGTALTPSP